jgi:NADPH-dependent glutamate synthase beta subunit-like oxidoreductase
VAIEGTEPWFDDSRGILTNTHGLVDASTDTLGGLYVSGWLKRGPSGIIGTNIGDAKDTVATIVHDVQESSMSSPKHHDDNESSTSLSQLLQERGVAAVDWNAYQKIDAAETSDKRKRNSEQPREKITSREELLQVALS